jgi:hypothetical protein
VIDCPGCRREIEAGYRFCPWCGVPQRRKLVEFFRPHPNSLGRALRVSRYYGDDPQVRFSVWEDGVARAAVSLDEEESSRLARFLESTRSGERRAQTLKSQIQFLVGRRER